MNWYFIILLLTLPFMGYGQTAKDSTISITVHDTVEEEIREPPPPNLVSRFKTINDWLTNICDNNHPKKAIATFKFGLFESKNDYTLVLTGENTYKVHQTRSSTRVIFEPKNMYYKLPESYYKGITLDQLLTKLSSDLRAFTQSAKFRHSFFTRAGMVIFDTNGTILWQKSILYGR